MKSGIYKITNNTNGKQYVGKAVELADRRSRHWRELRNKIHPNPHLQSSYNLYGKESFRFEVLEYIAIRDKNIEADGYLEDCEYLKEREVYWIDKLNTKHPNGYNIYDPITGRLGMKSSEETKAKISAGNKGLKRTAEMCARFSLAKMGNKAWLGKRHTEENKTLLSVSRMGEGNPFYGKEHTEETKAKISARLSSRKHTEEAKAKMSAANKGKPWSDARRRSQENQYGI